MNKRTKTIIVVLLIIVVATIIIWKKQNDKDYADAITNKKQDNRRACYSK